ncbi:MAG: bacterial/archaeal transporter family-2 protein [Frankiaceae bacterium]|nr:bacterial/archaeal transporter family-2 protein [Frankiaceae bacterium]MDX6224118.1 bacterial/archaeal transporter family-2 protein [Frankiales bacterium]MDX6274816.1 bacterial/archaeal transporter family-2 protein [Frankiales bacterium]
MLATPRRSHAVPPGLVVGLALGAGVLAAVQARVNGELGLRLHDAYLAALVSFGVGWVMLVALVGAHPRLRRALHRPSQPTRWWYYVGGAGGATLVAVSAAAAPVLGVALLTVGQVAGQTSGSLLVDRLGFGPAGRHAVTMRRLAGAGLALAAVLLAMFGRGHGRVSAGYIALAVIAGLAVSVQVAVNGRLRQANGEVTVTALVNFTTGTTLLAVGAVALRATGHLPIGHWPWEPWLYTGGPLGATFVAIAAFAVRHLGVLRLALLTIAGQLLGAALLDIVLPAAGHGLAATTVGAGLLTLVAVRVAGSQSRPLSREATA